MHFSFEIYRFYLTRQSFSQGCLLLRQIPWLGLWGMPPGLCNQPHKAIPKRGLVGGWL
jgi:hypothetical protein